MADGLTMDQIQTDVELRLRKSGMTVIPRPKTAILPYIYVNANLMKTRELYSYDLSVSLKQWVTVQENQTENLVATWSVTSIGTVGSDNMARAVRNRIGDFVDKFINAYLSVNPKQ